MQVTHAQVHALGERGYFVADAFLTPAEVTPILAAARARVMQGSLHEAGVRRGGERRLEPQVRSDRIEWVDPDPTGPFDLVQQRLERLRLQLNQEAFLGLRSVELQLAWYAPTGTRYDRHRDAFPGAGNRRLTVVLYLNEGWQPAHGGLLRLHLDPPLDIEPVAGRAVVFLSEQIEHEVLAAHADRFALSAWFSG